MPFCTSCGAEITRTDASHCTSCGAEIPAEMTTDAEPDAQGETPKQSHETREATSQQPVKGAHQPTEQHAHSGKTEAVRHGQTEQHHQGDTRNTDTHRERTDLDQGHRHERPRDPQQTSPDRSNARMASVEGSVGAPSTTWRNAALGLSAIATLSILAFFGLIMTSSPALGTSETVFEMMRYLLWAYPVLSFLAGIAIVADWWALKQADVSWLPAFGYAIGIGVFALTPIAAPIYYFHRP